MHLSGGIRRSLSLQVTNYQQQQNQQPPNIHSRRQHEIDAVEKQREHANWVHSPRLGDSCADGGDGATAR